jgi:hypothetical protein
MLHALERSADRKDRMDSARHRRAQLDHQQHGIKAAFMHRTMRHNDDVTASHEEQQRLADVHETTKPWMVLIEMASRLQCLRVRPGQRLAFWC